MRHRRSKFDVAHAFTTHFGQRHFNAALLANHTTVLQALVFTAQTFVILDRTKNFRAEQAVTFRLERSVVDSFRLFNFAVGP